MNKATRFIFEKYEITDNSRKIIFSYKTVFDDSSFIENHEELILDNENDLKSVPPKLFEALHLIIGTSYYKMYVAITIEHSYTLTTDEADFWNTIYSVGMGEFYYTNNLDFPKEQLFKETPQVNASKSKIELDDKVLVQFGGGKDSIVSAEILKSMGLDFDIFTLNDSDIQHKATNVLNKKLQKYDRKVDQNMLDLSKSGKIYTGHVPISVLYAFTATLHALLNGHKYIISSNEKSSDYGNVDYKDNTINHQWSKSLGCEKLIAEHIKDNIHPELQYFSLLRPIYEIQIAKIFSTFPEYFESFSSSNHHFSIDAKNHKRWDTDYSKGKVEFVFALMTAFLPKNQVEKIFEDNYYARQDLIPKFKKLLHESSKPFDCVGTPGETRLAMYIAHESGEYDGDPVMAYFEKSILLNISEKELQIMNKELFAYYNDENIPEQFKRSLRVIINERGISDNV